MKSFLRAAAATGVAAATLAAGLSFGPAAQAADSTAAGQPSGFSYVGKAQLIWRNSPTRVSSVEPSSYTRGWAKTYSSVTDATAEATMWSVYKNSTGKLWFGAEAGGRSYCLADGRAVVGPNAGKYFLETLSVASVHCSSNRNDAGTDTTPFFTWEGSTLVSDKGHSPTGRIHDVPSTQTGGVYALETAAGGQAEWVGTGAVFEPQLPGGGVDELSGGETVLKRGKDNDVSAGITATGEFKNLDVTVGVEAPEGTEFKEGQTVAFRWRAKGQSNWTTEPAGNLTDVKLSFGGRYLTGTVPSFAKADIGDEMLWDFTVVPDADAVGGPSSLVMYVKGKTDNGTVDEQVETPTLIETQGQIAVPITEAGATSDWTEFSFPAATTGTGTFTAPTGTTIDAIEQVDGQITARGTISTDGKMATIGSDSTKWDGSAKLRVKLKVDAAAAPGTIADGSFTVSRGTVVTGSASVGITVADSSKPAAPSNVVGYFLDDLAAWGHIKGSGVTDGASIIIKQGDAVIAQGTAGNGSFDLPIDPAKVGYGQQQFTVTQTVDGATSDPVDVALDYGQNTPGFTNPAEGSTIAGNPLTFTGTGNTGGKIQVNGTDFTSDTAIGSADVADGKWTVTNSSITLPSGPYQLWVNQRTKGGKIEFAGLNISVQQAKPASPTAEGYFPQNVREWAGIAGVGKVGATVVVRNADGDEIGKTEITDPSGTYNIGIDPAKVGYGQQQFTVTQTVDGATSDPVDVALDYGFEGTLSITSPTGPAVDGNATVSISGTAASGSKVTVTGTDFSSDSLFGSVIAVDGEWSLRTTLDLPAGPYQFWASQMTKGGKYKLTAINVEITR